MCTPLNEVFSAERIMGKLIIEVVTLRQYHEGTFYFCIIEACYMHEGSQYRRVVYKSKDIVAFKEKITEIQGQSFKQIIHKDFNIIGSR